MRKMIISLSIVFLFACIPITVFSAEKEPTTRAFCIRQVAQLMGFGGINENTKTEECIKILNEKGFDINAENLNSEITPEEESALINKVVNIKIESQEKIAEGSYGKAIINEVAGDVQVFTKVSQKWVAPKKGMQLAMEDILKTGAASYIYLQVGRFGRIAIKENAELTLSELSNDTNKRTEKIILNLAMGEVVVDARKIEKNSRFEVQTPTTLAAVRGTVYSVKIVDGGKMTKCE